MYMYECTFVLYIYICIHFCISYSQHMNMYINVKTFLVLLDIHFWQPHIKQEYPLNLSILISGGKETNKDSHSNGERSGRSLKLESLY
jgi:galactose-1-phosphate uridylyltransferase